MSEHTASLGENTRALKPPAPPHPAQRPLGLPVYRTAAFAFDTSAEYEGLLAGTLQGYSYSRIDNPTADAFASALAAMEAVGCDGPVVGQAFASGMAAISSTLLALTSTGSHIVAPQQIYGGTHNLLLSVLARFGVPTTFVDMTDLTAVRAAVRPETTVLWAETLANPTMAVADIPALASIAREAGITFAIDSTFASPAVCRPLALGADLVVHSATKYIGGHSDTTGGAVLGRPDLMAKIRTMRVELGGSLAPDDAFLLHRGLQTLPLRVARHCQVALAVAEGLADHPGLLSVEYPGLTTHRDHALANKLFEPGRYGAIMMVTPRGGRSAGMAFCDGLRLGTIGTSLGGTHTLVGHIASTTHRQLSPEALAEARIDPGAVRISIGLEDAEDLLTDITRSLDALG